MQTDKHILCEPRRRRIPASFSWVDHRLVREGHICRCTHEALALYLLLITVADADGLSYYSDTTAGRMLNMSATMLQRARHELMAAGLISYSRPLYQVLSLDQPEHTAWAVAKQGGGQ